MAKCGVYLLNSFSFRFKSNVLLATLKLQLFVDHTDSNDESGPIESKNNYNWNSGWPVGSCKMQRNFEHTKDLIETGLDYWRWKQLPGLG